MKNIGIFEALTWPNRWADFSLPPSAIHEFLPALRAFRPFLFNADVIRVGPNCDSGYVVPKSIVKPGGAAICVGIGAPDAIGFDEALADSGMKVFQFDHIVQDYYPTRENILFSPMGIGWRPSEKITTLNRAFSNVLLSQDKIEILKIDIEGDEWGAFDAVSSDLLSSVSTIVGEFHWLRHCRYAPIAKLVTRILNKISQTHVVVRLHPNNIKAPFTCNDIEFPNVLEVTFVNRNLLNEFKPRLGPVTDQFDFPSDPHRPEYQMINPWDL